MWKLYQLCDQFCSQKHIFQEAMWSSQSDVDCPTSGVIIDQNSCCFYKVAVYTTHLNALTHLQRYIWSGSETRMVSDVMLLERWPIIQGIRLSLKRKKEYVRTDGSQMSCTPWSLLIVFNQIHLEGYSCIYKLTRHANWSSAFAKMSSLVNSWKVF